MANYSSIYPPTMERNKLRVSYKDDSDDEKITGPPKLSDFGTALVMDKENIVPLANKRSKQRLGSTSTEYFSSNTNQTSFSQTYVSAHSGEPSQSTIFAQSRLNQQPSMTTMNADEVGLSVGDLDSSFRKIKNMQQSMRDELTTRHAQRRNRRFLNGTRAGILGPAKRAPSTSGAEVSDLSLENISAAVPRTDSEPEERRFPSEKLRMEETMREKRTVKENDENLIDFGDMNPVQYMKLHKLPSSELPRISRLYFERQRQQNHQLALQKNSASREAALVNGGLRSFSSIPSLGGGNKKDSPAPPVYPRRKLSDTAISSASRSNFQTSLFSPEKNSPNGAAAELQPRRARTATNRDEEPHKVYAHRTFNTLNHTKREALANIDINRSGQELLQQPKRLKPVTDFIKSNLPESESHTNREEVINKDSSKVRGTKRVEILEPNTSQGQIRRNVVKVNNIEYEKVELLGRGGSSKVYKVRDSGNRIYALKRVVFDEFDDTSVDGFKGEIELLKKLENEKRVVQLIDHEMEHGVLYLIMECGDHDLSQVLSQRIGMPLDMEFVRYHAREMLRCVKVVHDSGIVHSDLKPANFVFVKGILKIIDFGIANAVPDHTVNIYRENQIGTPNYMAPEALVAMNYTQGESKLQQQNRWKVGKSSDIWSCGCIIYQMIYGRPPYGGFQGQNRLLAIMNPDVKIMFSDRTSKDEAVPRSALDAMKSCLLRNPDKRPSADELLESNFLKPVMVTPFFIRDLIKNAVKYGTDQKDVSKEKVEELADDVLNRLADFRL
ncbi:hypothetical protein HG537_0D03240 [Torulaspora globosa]|uniref:Protein kinase domain-containing protein n=1 Tax=Torulaspora globosa TaxID=48254 RepID=A0A7H9HSR4_9SACH|nr:hypothetical protein HG537_0D03240 [Torulaspora sp. CBS 2947]